MIDCTLVAGGAVCDDAALGMHDAVANTALGQPSSVLAWHWNAHDRLMGNCMVERGALGAHVHAYD